jgi:2-(1,2-epoxy-1,2-dihydrophenyl)acetyl-CoA isomerase
MELKTIQLTITDAVATITLNRPEALNAIDMTVGQELRDVLNDLHARAEVRAILLTGAGRAFSAGGDIKQMIEHANKRAEGFFDEPLKRIHEAVLAIRQIPKPVIAAVNGYASGAGCNLALACDYRIAAASARFNQAFVRIGLVPDSGGTFILPRLVGWAKAAELMMTGEIIEAEEALRLGLVNRVVPDEQLMQEAHQIAARFAAGPTVALGRIKALLNHSATASFKDQLDAEREAQIELAKTADVVEGITAFVEKRPPKFEGK